MSSLKCVGTEKLVSVSTEELVNTSCPLQPSGHVRPSRSSLLQSTKTTGGVKAQDQPRPALQPSTQRAYHLNTLPQHQLESRLPSGHWDSLPVISAKKLAPNTLCLEVTGLPHEVYLQPNKSEKHTEGKTKCLCHLAVGWPNSPRHPVVSHRHHVFHSPPHAAFEMTCCFFLEWRFPAAENKAESTISEIHLGPGNYWNLEEMSAPGPCFSEIPIPLQVTLPSPQNPSLVAQTVKNLPALQETWIQPLSWEDPCRRKPQPTPVFLPGESHGQRRLEGHSPQVAESDRVIHTHSTLRLSKEFENKARLHLLITSSPSGLFTTPRKVQTPPTES